MRMISEEGCGWYNLTRLQGRERGYRIYLSAITEKSSLEKRGSVREEHEEKKNKERKVIEHCSVVTYTIFASYYP